MAGFDYDRIAAMSTRLHGHYKQGALFLVRQTAGEVDPDNQFDPVQPTRQAEVLAGVAEGVSDRFLEMETIRTTDLEIQCAPVAMGVKSGDLIEDGDKTLTIVHHEQYPPVGVVAYHTIIVRP